MCINTNTHPLINPANCLLVIIDVQEKLIPVISGKEEVVNNITRLARFSRIANIPVIITEQEKLGPTLPEVKALLPDIHPVKKIHFNCFRCHDFADQALALGRKTLILTGVEAHICVSQTALHASPDYTVHVVADAVSSRTPDNKQIALQRMLHSGSIITSTEMCIYELLGKAGTDEFKAALQLVK
ncbi:MAG: hydrolase [Syntrophus sp. (in: bacteria)]|nr:hydrolase [Syntrophus sp. (in: bacteria)]